MIPEETRKITFVCSKGDLDMAYPALIIGWAALGDGIDVNLFFTFWGMDIITKSRIDKLELAPVANTSMKMSMMGVNTGNLGIPEPDGRAARHDRLCHEPDEEKDRRGGRSPRPRVPANVGRRWARSCMRAR